jgi:hypothetical protein
VCARQGVPPSWHCTRPGLSPPRTLENGHWRRGLLVDRRQHRRQRRRADREQPHHSHAAADHRLAQNAEGTIAVDLGNSAQEVVLSRDPEQAARISRDDDAMDDSHKHLFTVLMDKEWKHGVAAAVDVTLLGRFYERFADHAVEIGRRVVFQVTGETPDD